MNIKKITLSLFSIAFFYNNSIAQNEAKLVEQIIKTANAQKTGNWQDVFTNFFQLAFKDIAGDNRSVDLKSSLFALRLKLNPSLSVDTIYTKRAFDRNFQFNTSLKLDSHYNFKSFNPGFTWAIINKRDSTIMSFIGKNEDKKFQIFAELISDALIKYRWSVSIEEYNKVQTSIQQMLNVGKLELDKLPENFKSIANKELETNFNAVSKAIEDELADIRLRPLLTLSVSSAFIKGSGVFNGAEAELVYLQGLTKRSPLELDLRLNFKSSDTLVNTKRYLNEIGFTGGMNIGVINSRGTSIPLIEFKPHLEFKKISRGLLPNEKAEMFSANATARVRFTKNLWLPLTLKYDLKEQNFLGFLNVSLNMDAFKK